jgi:15-cis-phytoene synthase
VSAPGRADAAYRRCESITRARAANFYYGIRLLTHERRRGMCAVYAFARRVDDIGDGTLEAAEKLRRLDAEARRLTELEADPAAALASRDPVVIALGDTYERFALPAGALGELIEGVRMDINGVSYERFEDLELYCRRVAGAIGRVCLAFFSMRESAATDLAHAEQLADDLGVALQLTNILRDVREDAQNGRVYLPTEDLRRFGVIARGSQGEEPLARMASETLDALTRSSTDAQQLDQLCALVRFEADRAAQWFDLGLELTDLLDRRSAACVLAMAGIYRRLLERIEAHPEQSLTRRMSLPAHEKAWVAARGMMGVGG